MTVKKQTSKNGPLHNDGKKGPDDQLQQSKLTAKYTIVRTKEDLIKIEKLRKHLQIENCYKSYKADSKIYKELPDLYLNAVKKLHDQDLAIDDLTAKLDQLQQLRTCFCRIFELCEIGKK